MNKCVCSVDESETSSSKRIKSLFNSETLKSRSGAFIYQNSGNLTIENCLFIKFFYFNLILILKSFLIFIFVYFLIFNF
jgi:hypothetical protein